MHEKPEAYEYNWTTQPDHDALQASKDRDAIYRVGGLRDQFAAAALTGICVSDKFLRDKDMNEGQALWAYEIADAMLAARKTRP